MTTNLPNEITHKPSKDLSKHRIVTNEPKGCHFSAEGVQIYSVEDIKAMRMMAQRRRQHLGEGVFVNPKEYRVDFTENEVEDILTRPKTAENWRGKVTMKNQAETRIFKQEMKGEVVRKKLEGLQKIKKDMQKNGAKEMAKVKELKEYVKPRRRSEMDDKEIAYGEDSPEIEKVDQNQEFAVEQEEGENCAPPGKLENASNKDTEELEKCEAMDSSFEDVEMDQCVVNCIDQILSNSDIFTNKLNKAIESMANAIEDKQAKSGRKSARASNKK